MRPFVLSTGICILGLGVAWAQSSGGGQQLPVGQTFKNFEFPIYQDGKLKATITAVEAKGITLNRAETTDLKISIYDANNSSTAATTVTSPKADLYVADQKMRTKNTVLIERADSEASAQSCDFDLKTKQYVLRNNVRVVLKNFDADLKTKPNDSHAAAPAGPAPVSVTPPAFGPVSPSPLRDKGSMLDSPGGYSNTNSAPTP